MIFIQKKLFRGQQEFRLIDDDQLRISFKGGGVERSYTISLLEIDPRFARIKTNAFGFLIAAFPTALFAAFMFFGALLGAFVQKNPAQAVQGVIVGAVFGGISLVCFRENSRKGTDIVAFYSRATGKPILTPWHNNPNPEAFDAFIKELKDRVKAAAIQRASETPHLQNNTMAGEILALKRLADDGGAKQLRIRARERKTARNNRWKAFDRFRILATPDRLVRSRVRRQIGRVTMPEERLPIYELENVLVAALRDPSGSNRLILQAPTGSGKSTQVPQILLDAGLLGERGRVVVLQPRRLPARMLAARVARERNTPLGQEVGYRIRLDNVTSARTRIEYVTEGILLRQMLGDPSLHGIDAILFDEFHERHLYGDITLARALGIQETIRPDLRLIVMSATLETGLLEKYLAPCETLVSRGRTFPVTTEYLPRPAPFDRIPAWELATEELARLAGAHADGDALVFMPGAYEISRTLNEIRNHPRLGQWLALPLHGELTPAEQDAAVARYPGRRKVVVSTNVAETSLTIDGVRIVIDAGIARIARFDPYRGINTLLIEKISRASADQRAGRAGRTAPGHCLRLWTEAEHADRHAQETPEVRRLDLAEVVLTLKASGVDDIHAFRWLETPERRALDRADALLRDLGALDRATGQISAVGRQMLAFPVHPRYARMLLAARERDCVRPVALLAALTQSRNLFTRSEGRKMDEERDDLLGAEHESDFFLLMRAFRFAENGRFDPGRCRRLGIHAQGARQAGELFAQFLDIEQKHGGGDDARKDHGRDRSDDIRRCVLVGFSDQLARRLDEGTLRCQLVGNRRGVLVRESAVGKARLIVAAEVREVQQRGDELNTLLTLATAVEESWLQEMFPDDFSETEDVFFDETARRVMVRRQRRFRDLALDEKLSDDPPREGAASLLAEEVIAGRCPLKNWDAAVEQWIARVNALAHWMPELGLPPISPDDRRALIEQLCYGATTYKAIKERAVWPAVRAWLSPQQQGWVEEYAPERIELHTTRGPRKVKLTYQEPGDGSPPVLAARIQELYDVTGSVKVAAGRVPVVIQVLAPNQRPIQVTQDLANFWRESYPKHKLELQRKYPKHEWR